MAKIRIRRGLESKLPVLDEGEFGFTTDTKKLYIGISSGNQLLINTSDVSGDMFKSIYDTDNDGIVDRAEDADTVDGFHLNQDVRNTASPTFANMYIPSFDNIKVNGVLTNKIIRPDITQLSQSPISPFLWHDVLAFCRIGVPTRETSVNGTTWTVSVLDKSLFAHKENQALTVLDASIIKSVRWTWTTSSLSWSNIKWLLIAYTYSDPTPSVNVTIENSSDGTTWAILHNSTYYPGSEPIWHYIDNFGGASRLRVTITHNSGGNIRLSGIRALTNRWGDQGQGIELKYPYSWDENMNITVLGTTLKVGSNEVWHKGNLTPTDYLPKGGVTWNNLKGV